MSSSTSDHTHVHSSTHRAMLRRGQYMDSYYTDLSGLREASQNQLFLLKKKLNIFATIISYSMPKRNKPTASHAYSITFNVIDPSLNSTSQSVNLNWFCNDVASWSTDIKVGDSIRAENVFFEMFNNFPLLSGKSHDSKITIFHKREDPVTGMMIVADQTTTGSSSSSSTSLLDSSWMVFAYGQLRYEGQQQKVRFRSDPQPEDANKESSRPDGSSPVFFMWQEEKDKLQRIYSWSRLFLTQTSLTDQSSYHSTLHAVQVCIHNRIGSIAYSQLEPQAPQEIQFLPNQTSFADAKCDIVCLIVGIIPPSATNNNNIAHMAVWDGTTNGSYQSPQGPLMEAMCVALAAPYIHTKFGDSVDDMQSRFQAVRASRVALHTGSTVIIKAAHTDVNHYITRLSAGTWIRIKNLRLPTASDTAGDGVSSSTPIIGVDAQISRLSPYYKDVMIIYDRYFDRLGKYKLSRMQEEANSRVMAAPAEPLTRPPSPPVVPQNPPVDATPALKTVADNGDPITILALACSGIAPAKFCSWAYITAIAPDDITSFTRKSQLTSERIFLFALEITDKTFPAVVHFTGKEAERFLNTTAEEFDASEEVRSSISLCLKSRIESRVSMEFRYHVIERKERVMYPIGDTAQTSYLPPQLNGGSSRSSNGGGQCLKRVQEDSGSGFYIRKIIQMMAVDTKLFT